MADMEKTAAGPKGRAGEAQSQRPNLIAFTIDADAGQIVKIEKVDSTGAHRELSDEDKANLVAKKGGPTLETVIERAFEAGIGCLLGEDREQDEAQESREESDLRHVLVMSLMEKTSAQDLLQHDVLGRAFLETAVQQVVASRAESSSAQQQGGGSTTKSRQATPPAQA